MYTPDHFESQESALEMLRRHDFGVLVSAGQEDLHTTHLPYWVSGDGKIIEVHMARANPHWQFLETHPACRLVVQGDHAYVSPSWYATAKSVPTWNYEAVHVDATAELVRDPEGLWGMVSRMSDLFEEAGSSWAYSALPESMRSPLLNSIVGVRLQINRGHAKQKLSQNRSKADRRRVAEELRKRGDCSLADRMLGLLED